MSLENKKRALLSKLESLTSNRKSDLVRKFELKWLWQAGAAQSYVARKGAAFFEQGWVVVSRGCVSHEVLWKEHGFTFHPSPPKTEIICPTSRTQWQKPIP